MDLPVFALHTVLFPGASMGLRVFEPRYLALLDDVLPAGTFAVVAIKHGAEVGGDYEANRVGATIEIDAHALEDDGTHILRVTGRERVTLVVPVGDEPYPVWQVEPYPDEGGAGTDDVETAVAELGRYLVATGRAAGQRQAPERLESSELDDVPAVPHDPVAASYVLAAATPGLVPHHQALLEMPGAGERLHEVRATFRRETALVRALGAGVGGAGLDVSTN